MKKVINLVEEFKTFRKTQPETIKLEDRAEYIQEWVTHRDKKFPNLKTHYKQDKNNYNVFYLKIKG